MNLQLSSDAIELDFDATSKKQVLEHLAQEVSQAYKLDRDVVFDALLAREQLGSTAVGYQTAIPHASIKNNNTIQVSFARAQKGIDFEATDRLPVRLFFVILAPEHANSTDYIRLLSVIARLLKNPEAHSFLLQEESAVKIYSFLQRVFEEV